MKNLLLTLLLTFEIVSGNAQNWNWAKTIGGNFSSSAIDDRGVSTLTDQRGNIYFTGSFKGQSISFDTTKIAGSGGSDIFLTKYDNNGKVLWSRAGGTKGDESPCGIAMDSRGFIYVVVSSVYPGSWPGEVILAKYDTLGNEIWVQWIGGGFNSQDYASGITIDKFDNIYVTGQYSAATVTFGSFTLNGYATSNIFVIKCDTSGVVSKAATIRNLNTNFGLWLHNSSGIAADTLGNIYITGDFNSDSISLGGSIKLSKAIGTTRSLFIAKYNSSLIPIWAKASIGGDGINGGLSTDRNNNVLVSGSFSNTINFDTLSLNGSGVFCFKFSPSGQVLLGKKIINGSNDGSYELSKINSKKICVDSVGNFYLTGYFNGTLIADATTVNKIGAIDIFVIKYSPNGSVQWIKQGSCGSSCYSNSVTNDFAGNIYISGAFLDNITFSSLSLQSKGSYDCFLIKYNSNGSVVYGKSYGSGTYKSKSSFVVCNDKQGNTYTSGLYGSDTIYFGSTFLTNIGGWYSAFTTKYDPAGNVVWSKRKNWNYDNDMSIAVDAGGNLYTTGPNYLIRKYNLAGNFLWEKTAIGEITSGSNGDPAPKLVIDSIGAIYIIGGFRYDTLIIGTIVLTKPATWSKASFIAKFDSSGNVIWAKVIALTAYWGSQDFSLNKNGEILVVGGFYQNALFDTITLSSSNGALFYARYNSNGNLVRVNKFETVGRLGNIFIVGNGRNTYVASNSSNNVTFGSFLLTGNGKIDTYLIKFDSVDNVVWAKGFGGTDDDLPSSIKLDSNENIYLLGNFYSPNISFGSINLTHLGNGASGFLAIFDSTGNTISAKKIGDSTINVVGMSISPLGEVSICGDFGSKSVSFDNNTLYNTDNSATTSDIFIAKACKLLLAKINIVGNTTLCPGDSLILKAESCPNCSYHWSNNDSGQTIIVTQAGSYYLTVSNLCGSSTSKSIDVVLKNKPDAVTIPTGINKICQGDSMLLTANICTGCLYHWSNGSFQDKIYVSMPDTYYVVVTNLCGSDTSSETTLIVNPKPQIPTITSNGTTLISSSINGNQWYLNGNIITGATSKNYVVTQNGNYTVVVSDSNGCSISSGLFSFPPTGSKNLEVNNFIIPNPCTGKFKVQVDNSSCEEIKIYNIIGEIIYQSFNDPNSEIDLTTQPKGAYFIVILTTKNSYIKKLIIQ